MKRFLLPLFALPLLASGGCGYFTNVPAQVTVATVTAGRVSYESTNSDGTRQVVVTEPSVTLRADPGSIGVSFTKCDVTYYPYDNSGTQIPSGQLSPLSLGLSFHLDASNYSSNPLDPVNPLTQADVGGKVYVAQYTFDPPIMSRQVEAYGAVSNGTSGNRAGLFAKVELTGTDDADFLSVIDVYVPVLFSGTPGTGTGT